MLQLDLNWLLQFVVTAFVVGLGLLYLVKNTASKYFVVESNFEADNKMLRDCCVVCSNLAKNQCSGCKMVRYCSEACQRSHWNSEHKKKCKDLKLSGKVMQSASMLRGRRTFTTDGNKTLNQSKKILFPYEEFVELYNWETPGFPPCGLLNCGNSCFANVVLQCLAYTRPLVAYLLERGHRKECRRNDWCFLCEFQMHMERASKSMQPFSPINILSRLTNIGGNLGYGKQEDAHEFMRFAIDTMQSVCLDEFGGEKAVHPSSQETTLIQHIFGGHLQSQVVCTKCNNVSNQFENMMDLTVEIQGDAASLEECLDQFTVREQLHGDNMYKCDGCNDYVLAWKRLTIRRAPNILTIALKRFQSGRFGKLNKRVTFPEILDLSPYMSETGDGSDVYKLYAVVVHVDMLNASYFGHYICYTKDFCGNWYRVDDCKVVRVGLDEVLSQGAYMLLYSRVCARPLCLNPIETLKKMEPNSVEVTQDVVSCTKQPVATTSSVLESIDTASNCGSVVSEDSKEDTDMVDCEASSSVSKDVEINSNGNGHSTEVDEESVLSPIENGKNTAKQCLSTDSLIKGSVQTQNHVSEKAEVGAHDATLISGEVLEENNSANSNGAEESGRKNSSGGKFKSSNGFAKTGLYHQNVDETNDDEKRDYEYSSYSSYSPLKSNKDTNKMVSRDSISFSNGVLDVPIVSGDDDVASVVVKQNSTVDEELTFDM